MASDVETIAPDETGHPQKWVILAIMCVSLILVVAGVSSLNIAIPSIIEELQPTAGETLWIVDSYALVFAGLLLPAGAIGDRYGRRGALLAGLVILVASAVLASQATSPILLIAGRSIMGIGAALIMPATLSILISVFPPHERTKAIAIWTGFAGAGGAIGIVGGGALLEAFWWGSVFFINVPIGFITIALTLMIVPTSRDDEQRPLDIIGSLVSIGGLGALVFAIIEGGEAGWTKPITLVAFAAAAVLLAAFALYELRTEHPLLDPRLFRHLPLAMSSFSITMAFAIMFGLFFIITQYFQFAQGYSPLQAGLRNLPFALAMIAVAPRSPAIAQRIGAARTIAAGFVIQAVGFAVLASSSVTTSYIVIAAGLIAAASGMALLMPVASEAIVSSLPDNKAGVGSAINDTTREVGGALGLAAIGTLTTAGYRSGMADAVADLPPPLAAVAEDNIGGAFGVAEQLGNPALAQAAQEAFVDGMSFSFWIAGAVGLASAVIVAVRYPRDTDSSASSTPHVVMSE